MNFLRQRVGFALLLCCLPAKAAIWTVLNTDDAGPGSLRVAMEQANAVPGPDVIRFNIPGPGPHTIAPASFLPAVTDPVLIDGYSQPGARSNSVAVGSDAVLKIRLRNFSSTVRCVGLKVATSNSVIRGLSIVGTHAPEQEIRASVDIVGGASNRVEGCYIGLEVDGTVAETTPPYLAGFGVSIRSNAFRTVIGGNSPAERNVFGGLYGGIIVEGSAENQILGNYVGVDPSGIKGRANRDGISLLGAGARHNRIGGNVVSSSGTERFAGGTTGAIYVNSAAGTVIEGNLIGTDATGRTVLENLIAGITLIGPSSNRVVGNLISGNYGGIQCSSWPFGSGTSGRIEILGNLIGTDIFGTNRLGNQRDGIYSDRGMLWIGRTTAGLGNVIAGSHGSGIMINSPGSGSGNTIEGSFIGTDRSGRFALGNLLDGIWLLTSPNTIGGTLPGAGNVIAYNGDSGIDAESPATIQGNSIRDNQNAGIDYGFFGSNSNDAGDTAPPQNPPELLSVRTSSTETFIDGQIRTALASSCRVEFFANPGCDAAGAEYLGFITVSTGSDGRGTFRYTHPARLPNGFAVTATATRLLAGTSKFSPCAEVIALESVDLSAWQNQEPNYIPLGAEFSVIVNVFNRGPANATGVVLTNPVPVGVSFVGAEPGQGTCVFGAGQVTCDLGEIAVSGSVPVRLTYLALQRGWTTNVAGVSSQHPERASTNDVSRWGFALGVADLQHVASVSATEVSVGQWITNTIEVTNFGPDDSWNVRLMTSVWGSSAADVLYECADCTRNGSELRWPQIEANSMRAARVIYRPTYAGTFTFTAGANADTPNPPEDFSKQEVQAVEGAGMFRIGSGLVQVREDAGRVLVPIARVGGSRGTVAVEYRTENGAADAGEDYVASTGVVTFADGETNRTLELLVLDDNEPECNEDFYVRLVNATGGASLYRPEMATVLILNRDSRPAGLVAPLAPSSVRPGRLAEGSESPSGSDDGRFIAFTSRGTDVSPGFDPDQSEPGNVFVRDHLNRTTVLASPIFGAAAVGAGQSFAPRLSGDGRVVVFKSTSSRLVEQGPNDGRENLYWRDLETGTTRLISRRWNGGGGVSGYVDDVRVSRDGSVVVFSAISTGLVAQAINPVNQQIYVYDAAQRTTDLVSVSLDGNSGGNGYSSLGGVTPDGRFVVFGSDAGNLVDNDSHPGPDVFLRDLVNQTTALVSIDPDGNVSGGSIAFGINARFMSDDGRVVVFEAEGSGQTWFGPILVRDVIQGVTQVVHPAVWNASYFGAVLPSLTADGTVVGMIGLRSGMTFPIAEIWRSDLLVHDLVAGTWQSATVDCQGDDLAVHGTVFRFNLSDDGRYASFKFTGASLVPGDLTGPNAWDEQNEAQVYRRDLLAGTTVLISQNQFLTGPMQGEVWDESGSMAGGLWSSADGRTIAFVTTASDVVEGDDNDLSDVFIWREGLPPRLTVSISNQRDIVLTWPREPDGFRLETSSVLEAASIWNEFEGGVVQAGELNRVTIPNGATAGSQFFRLRR